MKPGNIKIGLFVFTLLFSTLACVTIMGEASPVADSPDLPVTEAPIVTESPSRELPSENAYCPSLTDRILEIANTLPEESNSMDESSRNGGDVTYLVTYIVSGSQISDPLYEDVTFDLQDEQSDTTTQQDIWNYFAALIPAEQRRIVAEYSVMTDGEDNLLAAVTQTYDDPALWVLEVDIADTHDTYDLTYTLIHEFGHLLTLSPGQVTPSDAIFNHPDDEDIYLQEVSACPNYFPGEGCAQPDSYINSFYNQFWPYIHEEWQAINLEEDDDTYYERLDDFYNKYQDQFVNAYAPTNPEEDIAEAWSFFVLEPKPDADTIAKEKVLFFYDYPELIRLREQILSNLCTAFPK